MDRSTGSDSSNNQDRKQSLDEYKNLHSFENFSPKNEYPGIFKRGFNYLLRRSKSDVKEEGAINKSVPCYWHEQK
jgi:hypothetical protein